MPGHDFCGLCNSSPCECAPQRPATVADIPAMRGDRNFLKEWRLLIFVITKDGVPVDYTFARSTAFAKMRKLRDATGFWAVSPANAILGIGNARL